MDKKVILTVCEIAFFCILQVTGENIAATKVFIIPIESSMFNWTMKTGDDYVYRASLLNTPDLPKWIEYLYSKRHKTGFLYGVPSKNHKDLEMIGTHFHLRNHDKRNVTWVQIEIIATNKKTYETRRRIIHLNVEDKLEPATHQVHLKIDNLNVEDFFDLYRMSRLLNIFKYKLWKESFFDLYFTFLTSAVSMGARLPLRPTEGEGVVVRLGSVAKFSSTLTELQEEVKPLWKLHTCPRDFKRTTVERIFRDEGFVLDWCNFRLIHESAKTNKPSESLQETPLESEMLKEPLWSRPTKAEVSRRNYAGEFAFTILVPAFIMILLVVLLSVILGFQRESMRDDSDDFFDSVFLVCEDYFRSKKKSMRSETSASQFMSNLSRAPTAFRHEVNGTTRSRTSSPQVASRMVATNGITRPTPPPYTGTMRTTVVDF